MPEEEREGRLGSLEGDGAFWFAVTLLLWLPFFFTLLQMPHFAFWDFWCAPTDVGVSVSGFFFLIAYLGIAWTMARALADASPPPISRLLLEVVVLGFLSVLIYVMTVWFNSPSCRVAASQAEARAFARTLGEEWVPPEGYRAVACRPFTFTPRQCWRRKDLPPFAEADPFELIPPAESVDDRPAVCEEGLRLAYRPQLVEVASESEAPPKSQLLTYCETERRIPRPSDAIFLFANILQPQPENAPVILAHLPDFYICRFSEDGRLQSASRFNHCDQLEPLRPQYSQP